MAVVLTGVVTAPGGAAYAQPVVRDSSAVAGVSAQGPDVPAAGDGGSVTRPQARAQVKARATGRSVAVGKDTTSASSLTANPDGSFTWVSSAAPVRVKRGGDWTDIDTTLQRSGRFVTPRAPGTGVWLARGKKGALVRVGSSRQAVRDSEAGELSVGVGQRKKGPRLGMDVRGKVRTPKVSGSTATYRKVWPGVKVHVNAEPGGASTRFVSAKGRTRFPLRLTSSGGLSHRVGGGGVLSIRGPGGGEIGSSGRPLVTGVNGGSEAKVFGHAKFKQVRRAKKSRVDLVVPPKVARRAGGAAFTVNASQSLAASHATYVQKSYKTTNFVNAGLIKTGGHIDGPGPVENTVSNALVKFGGVGALDKKVISSAELEVWNWWCGDCGSGHLDAHLIDEDWEPKKVTWESRPKHRSIGGSINDGKGGNAAQKCDNGWLKITNMKDVAAVWANNPANAHGIALLPGEDSNHKQYKQFDTISGSHSSHPPKMTVTYFAVPAAPSKVSVPNPAHTPHPPLTSTAPAYGDGDGGSMMMEFVVARNPTAAPAWQQSFAVGSGQTLTEAVLAIPPGQKGLADGSSWEARSRVIVNGTLSSAWSDWTTFTVDTNPYVRDLQVVPSLANVAPAPEGDVYTQTITPTFRIHLTETFPGEQFTVTFFVFAGDDLTNPIGQVSTTPGPQGWASAALPGGILVDGGRYEVTAHVVDEDSPTPHPENGPSFIVDVQAPCKSPAVRSLVTLRCVKGTI